MTLSESYNLDSATMVNQSIAILVPRQSSASNVKQTKSRQDINEICKTRTNGKLSSPSGRQEDSGSKANIQDTQSLLKRNEEKKKK